MQTSALPLGYVAVMPILAYSCRAVKVLILGTLHAMMMCSKIVLCVEIVSPHIGGDVGLCDALFPKLGQDHLPNGRPFRWEAIRFVSAVLLIDPYAERSVLPIGENVQLVQPIGQCGN